MSDILRKLCRDPYAALSLGVAAEHLVCADLILNGYRCYLSDQGLPYDLVVDVADIFIRVQVKAACFPRNSNHKGTSVRQSYQFSVKRRGKDGRAERLSHAHCDLVAMVALDIRAIAYRPLFDVGQTCQLLAPGQKAATYRNAVVGGINDFPFSTALKN